MSAYHRIFSRLTTGTPLKDLLNILALAAEETHPGVRASFTLASSDNNSLQLISAPSFSKDSRQLLDNIVIADKGPCCARAAYFGKRILVEDIETTEADSAQHQFMQKEGIIACLSEPIKNIKEDTLGTFGLHFSTAQQLKTIDDDFIQLAVKMASSAIEQKADKSSPENPQQTFEAVVMERVAELIKGKINQLSFHGQFEQLIATLATHFIKLPANAIDAGINKALQSICEFHGQERATILLLEHDNMTISASHSWGAGNAIIDLQKHQNIDMTPFRWGDTQRNNKHGIYCNDINTLPPQAAAEYTFILQNEVKSFAFVPMIYGRKVKGYVSFATTSKTHNWNDDDIVLLSLACDMLVNALQRKHYDEIFHNIEDNLREVNSLLAKEAREDGLTHIANRRYFNDKLSKEYRRATREGTELSLIICDIDCFKNYNDTYGHLAGDACLIKIAETLSQSFQRAADLPARYGGEEFAIILPNTNENDSRLMAERLREKIAELAITHSDSSVAPVVTISAGCATLTPDHYGEESKLIDAADRALYEAKHNGRNRVVVSDTV